MNLYEITNDYLEKLELINEQGINPETGEITEDENQIAIWREEIKTDLINKNQNIIAVIRNRDLEIEAIDKEIERLNKLKQYKKNSLDRFKGYVKDTLINSGIEKIETPLGKISFTATQKTEVYDMSLLDRKFIRVVPAKEEPDKTAIKKAINAGEEVQGARIIKDKNLKIS